MEWAEGSTKRSLEISQKLNSWLGKRYDDWQWIFPRIAKPLPRFLPLLGSILNCPLKFFTTVSPQIKIKKTDNQLVISAQYPAWHQARALQTLENDRMLVMDFIEPVQTKLSWIVNLELGITSSPLGVHYWKLFEVKIRDTYVRPEMEECIKLFSVQSHFQHWIQTREHLQTKIAEKYRKNGLLRLCWFINFYGYHLWIDERTRHVQPGTYVLLAKAKC